MRMKDSSENLEGFFYLPLDKINGNLANSILDKLEAFVCIVDIRLLKFIWINKYMSRKLGYSFEELTNLSSDELLSLFHPDFQKNLVDSIRQLNGKLDSNEPSVFKVRTKENHWIWIMATSSVYENNPDGSYHYLLASANEIDIQGLNLHLIRLAEKTALNPNEELFKLISHRERTILQLIANGNTDKEIARDLNISIHTAKTHRKKIIHKLGLKNSRTLIKYAFQNGLD